MGCCGSSNKDLKETATSSSPTTQTNIKSSNGHAERPIPLKQSLSINTTDLDAGPPSAVLSSAPSADYTQEEICVQVHGMIQRNNVNIIELKKFIQSTPNGLEVTDRLGLTPLHLASKLGQFNVVKLLIDMGADVNAKTFDGNTPLHYAIGHNRFDCAMRLKLSGADDDIKNNQGVKACTGFDGMGSYGIAAIFTATGPKQAEIAFKICDAHPEDVDPVRFSEGLAVMKKNLLNNGWSDDLERESKRVEEKIRSVEHNYDATLATTIQVVDNPYGTSKLCRPDGGCEFVMCGLE